MAKFTKTEELFNYVQQIGQSVGPVNVGNPLSIYDGGTRTLGVFYPERGQNIEFRNPLDHDGNEPYVDAGSYSSHIIEDYDGRESLGTIVVNEREDWPDVNYNPATLSPYLTKVSDEENKEDVEVTKLKGRNGENIFVPNNTIEPLSVTYRFSIDALPFVLNSADDDEIIHLDRYYDRQINPIEYGLATEGKINFYLYPRADGRESFRPPSNNVYKTFVPWMERGAFTAADPDTGVGGASRFNAYAKSGANAGGPGGFYLFKLNWGDGSPLQYTTDPLLLEQSTLLEHYYDKPGFYKITGVVYASFKGLKVDSYELFETSIFLNPSKNYSLKMFDYDDFAMIGGVSRNSALSRTAANILGIDPLKLSISPDLFLADERSGPEVIEKLNLIDKLDLLNYLSKLEGSVLTKFNELLEPYSGKQPRVDEFTGEIEEPDPPTEPSDYDYFIFNAPLHSRLNLIPEINYGIITFKLENALVQDDDADLFRTTNPNPEQSFDIDWNTVSYEVELKYYDDGSSPYYDDYGQSEWLPLGTYPHSQVYDEDNDEIIVSDVFQFQAGHPVPELEMVVNEPYNSLYIPGREYQARVRINAQELQHHNPPLSVSSGWIEMEEEGVVALPTSENTAKVFIDINLNIAGDYQSGDGFPTLSPEYPSGFDNLFLNAANTEVPIQGSTAEDWEFGGWSLGGNNNGLFLEDGGMQSSERINKLMLSEGYSYDPNAEDTTMVLNANYSYNGSSGEDPPPELATIDIELLPPQNPSGNDTDEATYSWNSGNDETQLTTNFDSDSAVISAPDRVVSMVAFFVQGGGGQEITQDQNQAVVAGVRFTLNGGNLTAQNENEMEGSFESIEVQAIMTSTEGGGGGGGNSCFLEGTMITMADGKKLPIEDIQVGMEVMSFDDNTGETTQNKVVEVFHHPKEDTDAYLIINDTIKVTENHVMYVPNDRYTEDDGDTWLRADHIIVGDFLIGKSVVEVTSIEKVNESVATYNFEVENTHTYFAEDVVVHNAGGGPGGGSGKQRQGGTETGADGSSGGAG